MKIFLSTLLLAITLPAQAAFISGNALHTRLNSDSYYDKGFTLGFIAGVFDTISDITVCTPDNVTMGQMRDLAKQHLEARPDIRHFPANEILVRYFSEVFPCKKRETSSPPNTTF